MSQDKDDFLSTLGEEEEEEDDIIDVEGGEVTGVTDTAPPAASGENSLVRPVANVEEVAEVYQQFESIKEGLLKEEDTQQIGAGKNKTRFITKSGWRKIATAFNVSVDVTAKERSVEDGVVVWRVKARATAPNGKVTESWSSCASNESNHMEYIKDQSQDFSDEDDVFKVDGKFRRLKHPREVNDHDILATAETRAKNRAISDLVGGGSVSAEEVSKDSVLE